ncbi:transketolase C-terminal domain-containing protein [uncultured Sphaerochaeta sp.]|uniref:transketolase family protein n=1 Tax=uncultured Sphaerochaeta sp. TaxID=886478 RepID=UPI002A0A12FE|nr:transketolase C-terminal domain-containing protein [uncultured Sphaerochaeta sp.]
MRQFKSNRESFSATLLELAKENPAILAVSSDARGSCSLNTFVQELPDQFVEAGIAEQDEMGIAAGLAAVGKHPYVCAPACFLSTRALEQIKIDVAYSHQNVKIFGVSGGVSYGALGASHHSLHDIATLRCFPDLSVIIPSDAVQTEAMLKVIEKMDQAVYIRVGREAIPIIYDESVSCAPFVYGKANTLREGTDVTIIACGELVYHALEVADSLLQEGLFVRVLDMATLKPFDQEAVEKAARETGAILTVEEHSINGGLGATVSQIVCGSHLVPVINLAFPDEYLVAGDSQDLFKHYGLDETGIKAAVIQLLKRKQG